MTEGVKPPYGDFAHIFVPNFGRCGGRKCFISINFSVILNLAFCPFRLFCLGGQPGKSINKGEDIMKKRIVSMILALSMVLSILPVSAFADAGTSAAAAETTAAGTNEETTNSVVTIKIGADGLPEEQSGTGWSYDSSNNWLAIAGVPNAKTEYILDGDASCNVASRLPAMKYICWTAWSRASFGSRTRMPAFWAAATPKQCWKTAPLTAAPTVS